VGVLKGNGCVLVGMAVTFDVCITWLRLLTLSTLSSRNWAELTKDADRSWLLIVVVLLLLPIGSSMDEMMSITAAGP
jgi:hypothetical protein